MHSFYEIRVKLRIYWSHLKVENQSKQKLDGLFSYNLFYIFLLLAYCVKALRICSEFWYDF